MKSNCVKSLSFVLMILGVCESLLFAQTQPTMSHRLPNHVLPVIGCWFWAEAEFEPDGYKGFIDLVGRHSPYNLLTTSLRVPLKELTDPEVHKPIQAAAVYAQSQGTPIVMDLDVRLARRAFQKLYPDELQQMLLLQEIELSGEEVVAEIRSRELSDHYTHRTTPYISLQGKLARVYSYRSGAKGIDPTTLQDITSACEAIDESSAAVRIRIPGTKEWAGSKACVMVSFTHLAADVFAPHLLDFQRDLLEQYADVPLAGACKDEWGFPPCFDGNPAHDLYWYSKYRAEEYARRTGGRELLFDCLLMFKGMQGRERERSAAINHFMEMSWQRNAAIEEDFYKAVKNIWGETAVVATHPTWWPYPDSREMMKNGLDWWAAKRDWAQTDELTPFAVRTALSKKWGSPIWYNMFYSGSKTDYEKSVWTHVLAGGRINYHPLWPSQNPLIETSADLLRGDLMRAESRIRLLNYITKSPLDCPVAVFFGHANAMNWAGADYNDVGMEIADALWREGFPADLIPTSEIENGNLQITQDGYIAYGSQRYSAVILYRPEFSRPSLGEFFQKAANGKTALYRIGKWTQDFEANPLGSQNPLPDTMIEYPNNSSLVSAVCQSLKERNIEPQTPATGNLRGFESTSVSPSTEGYCRLLDGTLIFIAGTQNVAGDAIKKTIAIKGHSVSFEATGVVSVRLDREGDLEALAAGSLKKFSLDDFSIILETPEDLALWKDSEGVFHGIVQNYEGPIEEELKKITPHWEYLSLPSEINGSPMGRK